MRNSLRLLTPFNPIDLIFNLTFTSPDKQRSTSLVDALCAPLCARFASAFLDAF